jgi:hypothetical protein
MTNSMAFPDHCLTLAGACLLLAALALTACGGGGGSSQGSSAPRPVVNDSPCVASSAVQPDGSVMPTLNIPNADTSLASVSNALASLAADNQEVTPVCSAASVAAIQNGS